MNNGKTLSEIIPFEHSFGAFVNFGDCSGVGFGAEDFDKLLEEIEKQLTYYQGIGRNPYVGSVYAVCSSCGGSGEIPFERDKNKRRGYIRHKPCKACKGIGKIEFGYYHRKNGESENEL